MFMITHHVRPWQSLDGFWDFTFLGAADLESFEPGGVKYTDRLPVPSAFDALPMYAGKRGAAVYRRSFTVPAGHPARLDFGAVTMWTRVYVDGVRLKEHACGYSPFRVEVPASEKTERELVVLVDNRYDFERVPMHEEYFDFYQYGGIIRSVGLNVLPVKGPHLAAVQVTPTAEYREGGVSVLVKLGGEVPERLKLGTAFDGGETQWQEITPVSGEAVVALRVPQPRVWSPESPALHVLRVSLGDEAGKETDDLAVRFGLRRIETAGPELRLNGEKLILKGYNRHEWHPNFGPCTPRMQQYIDLQLMRDMGCNFIRGCHYPQDQGFLDLCDELGFLVWEENLGWGQREKTFQSEKFVRDHAEALEEMVEASFNHPSIIMWGFLNEAGSDKEYARAVFEQTAATLKRLDPSRLVTYASMYSTRDLFFHLADVVSINIYPGWYGCEGVEKPLEMIKERVDNEAKWIDENGFADKPFLISEIGAEGLYGWHDPHNDFYTEEHQAEYLRLACESTLENPRYCGIALWHFSDARTYGGGWSMKRPRTFNNKGTVTEYRQPKLAYRAVKKAFRGE